MGGISRGRSERHRKAGSRPPGNLQWVAQMSRICGQDESADAETRSASLLHLVRADIDDFVLARFGGAREEFLVSPRLSFQVLLVGEPGDFGIADPVQAVVGDLCYHMPIRWVDEIVCVRIPVFWEVVVYLKRCLLANAAFDLLSRVPIRDGVAFTFVAMICALSVSPG